MELRAEYLEPVANGVDHGRERVDRRRCAVELPATVIGDDDAGRPAFRGAPRVVSLEHPLDHDGNRPLVV